MDEQPHQDPAPAPLKRYAFGALMGNVGMFEDEQGDYVKLADVQASAWLELLPWQPVSAGLPDAETNVLLALADGTTCEGFYDGHWEHIEGEPPLFRDVCADPLDVGVVIAWAEMPGGPARQPSAAAAPGACARSSGCECATSAAQAVCMHRKVAVGASLGGEVASMELMTAKESQELRKWLQQQGESSGRGYSSHGAPRDACVPEGAAALPLNGIPRTWAHDEGAYAQCADCGRYTLDPTALGNRGVPTCACGSTTGWSGSFNKPSPDAKWSGTAPRVLGTQSTRPEGHNLEKNDGREHQDHEGAAAAGAAAVGAGISQRGDADHRGGGRQAGGTGGRRIGGASVEGLAGGLSDAGKGPEIDTADHVAHGPTGETWVIARVSGEHLYPCGWPPSRADLGDCTLVKKATAAERDKLLQELAAGQSEHAIWASDALGVKESQ